MEHIGFIVQLTIFLLMIGIGLIAGRATERWHLRGLADRESGNGDFLIAQSKVVAEPVSIELPPTLICGEAVIATDFLKSFLAVLRRIFGGEIQSYHMLLVRARREALQRIVEQARQRGFDAICNLRYQTADVGGNTAAKRVATVAILASATAYRRAATDGR